MMSDWTALHKNYYEKGAERPLRFLQHDPQISTRFDSWTDR